MSSGENVSGMLLVLWMIMTSKETKTKQQQQQQTHKLHVISSSV